jgi:RNA polymerase sigma factor (sigma-70 family)
LFGTTVALRDRDNSLIENFEGKAMTAPMKKRTQEISTHNPASTTSPHLPEIHVEQLFSKHYVNLIRFTRRYVWNVDDAKDIVQATFIEAIRCSDRYNGNSLPSTWLFGIALNLARDHARKYYAASIRMADESLINDLLDTSANPADLVENLQLANNIAKMIAELPQRLRETFVLVLEHEANYAEAAKKMQVPIGTVRSRISRVRQQIHAIVD